MKPKHNFSTTLDGLTVTATLGAVIVFVGSFLRQPTAVQVGWALIASSGVGCLAIIGKAILGLRDG